MSNVVVNSHEMECPQCGSRVIGLVWSNGHIEMECSNCGIYANMTVQELRAARKTLRNESENTSE